MPILSSDAISSVAYAGEEILYVLVPIIALAAYTQMFYITLAIIALLCILVFSYRQTIDSYPCGGGSYIVAHDNLGSLPGLTAAATLSIDYILTVAVSACAGTAAITSAIPELLVYKVPITLLFIFILTLGNLRGVKDSSRLFGIPTYAFIFSMIRQKWEEFNINIPLVVSESPFRDTVTPLLEYIKSEKHASKPEDMITIVLPQFVVRRGWHNLLHNQTSYFIRSRLMLDKRIAIVTVPYPLNR